MREIGIRKALGAQPGQLVGMVLGEGMVLVAIGGVIGAVLAGAQLACCRVSCSWDRSTR